MGSPSLGLALPTQAITQASVEEQYFQKGGPGVPGSVVVSILGFAMAWV